MLNTWVYAKELRVPSEDELIVQGLLYEEYRAFDLSRAVFGALYDRTGAKVYLFREVASALLSKTNIVQSIDRLRSWDKKHPDTLEARRLLIPLYLTVDRFTEAKKEAETLLERSDKAEDIELASNPFLYTGEYKRALALLEKVYAKTYHENVLLRMTIIMDEYMDERKKAIQLLETHRRMYNTSAKLYYALLELYVKENDADGLLNAYKGLYEKERDEKYLKKIIEVYAYKRDIKGAIEFLEKSHASDLILYELYKRESQFDKAFLLIDRLYEENKDARWIAEKGVLLFEKAENKNDKKMIKEVLSYFEKAIELGVDDSIYLNYYGYTLIDKEIDVERGIKHVKEALFQQPDNAYYLDSLAWGYYKQQKCSKSFEIMKRVIEKAGLEAEEIVEHWNAIQKCK